MEMKSVIGGAIAALIGAVVWGLVGWLTNTELGILAWGIGAMVGWATMLAGSPGVQSALIASVLAVLSIVGGKVASIQFSLPGHAREFAETQIKPQLTVTVYESLKVAGQEWKAKESSVEEFMLDHGFTEETEASRISSEEVKEFQATTVPLLEKLGGDNPPSHKDWQAAEVDQAAKDIRANISIATILPETFSLFDILWIVLGVGTAFRLGMGGTS